VKIGRALLAGLLMTAACARQVVPADLDTANTACRHCRMQVSDVHFAAQITAPGAEPVFFDDIGCLRDYVKQADEPLPANAVAFVADHRTGAWVRATAAVFTRPAHLATPMEGGIIAHDNETSRRQDPDAAGGAPVTVQEIFGVSGPPNGGKS
jgi:copper chaperone NosL